ncbi:hypothetical protein, partial [Salmonella sp. s55004]|uniref:hypothetical protein n=1 Tax=Salmonella sp. s55004 TaxID=3159675 RepID=UPI003980A3B8
EDQEDCSEASKCCLIGMPNLAEFVSRYQQEARVDGFADPYAKNQYIGGAKRTDHVAKKTPLIYKRSAASLRRMPMQRRINPYLNGQRIETVVAKKAPAFADHLEIM